MIDYDKINEYIATMISKSGGCAQLTGVAFNDLFGAGNLVISEKDLHDGFEYIIARHKKQKEVEKNIRELILKSIEEQINVYLKSQNRLL